MMWITKPIFEKMTMLASKYKFRTYIYKQQRGIDFAWKFRLNLRQFQTDNRLDMIELNWQTLQK